MHRVVSTKIKVSEGVSVRMESLLGGKDIMDKFDMYVELSYDNDGALAAHVRSPKVNSAGDKGLPLNIPEEFVLVRGFNDDSDRGQMDDNIFTREEAIVALETSIAQQRQGAQEALERAAKYEGILKGLKDPSVE